jgi:hypothetical protein
MEDISFYFQKIIEKDGIKVDSSPTTIFILAFIQEGSRSSTPHTLPPIADHKNIGDFLNAALLDLIKTGRYPSLGNSTNDTRFVAAKKCPTATKSTGWLGTCESVPSAVVVALQHILVIAKQSRLIAGTKVKDTRLQAEKNLQAALGKLRVLAGVAAPAVKK